MSEVEPESPCISVCLLDDKDICVGCYRSADEITDWFLADAAGRRDILQRALPEGVTAPEITRCFHAGDGTMLEVDGLWFELRASGTDAVLRYYMEGEDAAQVATLNEALTRLDLTMEDS